MRPFIPNPRQHEALMISETEGVFVVEPMRFLFPCEAKREARRTQWPSERYRLLYRQIRAKGISTGESRRMVFEQIRKDGARAA